MLAAARNRVGVKSLKFIIEENVYRQRGSQACVDCFNLAKSSAIYSDDNMDPGESGMVLTADVHAFARNLRLKSQ